MRSTLRTGGRMSGFPGEETLVGSWHALAKTFPGACVRQRGRTVTAVFPSEAALNNAILQDHASAQAATEVAAELAVAYEATNAAGSWALWLRSSLVSLEQFGPHSGIRGMARHGNVAVMTRTLIPGPSAHPSLVSTSVRAAMSPESLSLGSLPAADGVPGLDGWLLLQRGVPVVGGWTYLHGTDCGLYGVTTLPHPGRRGLTVSFVRHVLARLQRRGARTASVQSAPTHMDLYTTLGFRARARYEKWVPSRLG